MTSDQRVMLVCVWTYWTAWWLLAIVSRRSYIPVIPIYPLALGAVGYLLNFAFAWSGTFAVLLIHLAPLGIALRDATGWPSNRHRS